MYDLARGKVLEMLQNREKATLEAFLRGQPREWREAVRVVAIDMWAPYAQAAQEVFGERVRVVVDKFHVVKQLSERIQYCRRAIQREASEEVRAKLKGTRWSLLKPRERLSDEERGALDQALRTSPELRQMYELKQEFMRIYRPGRRQGAIRRLRRWAKKVQKTTLIPLHLFVKTLRNWWKEITEYFRSGITNAAAEGLNLTIRLVQRRAYGFRNHQHFRLRVLHETGSL